MLKTFCLDRSREIIEEEEPSLNCFERIQKRAMNTKAFSVGILSPLQFFGEEDILKSRARNMKVICETVVGELLEIPRDYFLKHIIVDEQIKQKLEIMAQEKENFLKRQSEKVRDVGETFNPYLMQQQESPIARQVPKIQSSVPRLSLPDQGLVRPEMIQSMTTRNSDRIRFRPNLTPEHPDDMFKHSFNKQIERLDRYMVTKNKLKKLNNLPENDEEDMLGIEKIRTWRKAKHEASVKKKSSDQRKKAMFNLKLVTRRGQFVSPYLRMKKDESTVITNSDQSLGYTPSTNISKMTGFPAKKRFFLPRDFQTVKTETEDLEDAISPIKVQSYALIRNTSDFTPSDVKVSSSPRRPDELLPYFARLKLIETPTNAGSSQSIQVRSPKPVLRLRRGQLK
eukprot:TRINITY_DN470_c0_g3_i2.p1 TRINITY_DN470_c0_g3~~TRINITY_DN470_c0_g3_i2.p1  ORF type:complete len:397 (+),score=55.46 TRINITY_DN470_c0_g3_i2:62-1252(+)